MNWQTKFYQDDSADTQIIKVLDIMWTNSAAASSSEMPDGTYYGHMADGSYYGHKGATKLTGRAAYTMLANVDMHHKLHVYYTIDYFVELNFKL